MTPPRRQLRRGDHRSVQRDHGWRCREQLRHRSRVHCDGRCGQQRFCHADHHSQDTTAPEFTFVPADYTVECSDEMPMDDATASDNCGEVTIEVSARPRLAMPRATT